MLLELALGTDEDAVVVEAQRRSIRVYGAKPYYAVRNEPHSPALLVGSGGLDESRIPRAVAQLAGVLRDTVAQARRRTRRQAAR